MTLSAASQHDTKLTLERTGAQARAFHMINHGTKDMFSINNGIQDVVEVQGGSGDAQFVGAMSIGRNMSVGGNMNVGSQSASGSRTLSVSSKGSAAINIKSSSSDSALRVYGGSNSDASLTLGSKDTSFSLLSSASEGALIVKDISSTLSKDSTLLSLNSSHGMRVPTGNFSVGGDAPGARSLLVQSLDSSAELNISSSMPAGQSQLSVMAAEGGDAKLYLGQSRGIGFSIANKGSSNKLSISSTSGEVLNISATGDTWIAGATRIGSSAVVKGAMSVEGDLHVRGQLKRSCTSAPGVSSARWSGNNHCYMLVESARRTFADAQQHCQSMGGYLASLKSPQESAFIKTNLQPVAKSDFFIGYTDIGSQKNFQWVTGEIAVYNNTHLYNNWENPNNLDGIGQRDCVAVYTSKEDAGYSTRGTVSRTISGRTCRKWSATTPHGYIFNPTQYPDAGLGDHNFCRNPDKRGNGAFCVTTDPGTVTESCDVTGVWRDVACTEKKAFLCERDF
jgi:hypothetical protein